MVPRRLAELYRTTCRLELHEPPLALPPLEISSVIHRRNESDEGLAWLSGIIEAAAGRPL